MLRIWSLFELVEAGGKDWPQGVVYREGRMYQDVFLLIPEGLEGRDMRALNSQFCNPGGPQLWLQVRRIYQFPNNKIEEKLTKSVKRQCEICQATEASLGPYKARIRSNPIPTYLMSNVTVDLFSMPEVTYESQIYDTISLCVDRLSG